jgi:hypothetical protein
MYCRLCNSANSKKFFSDDRRAYYHCEACGLLFVPVSGHISREEEKQRYALHDNSAQNEGYVKYLNEIVSIVCARCCHSDRILDYGSGKNGVLTRLLREKGYACTAFDPLYRIGKDALTKSYDMIILCEVIEHIRDIGKELLNIKKALRRLAGKVIIRTQLYPSLDEFAGWWYKNDITHINFFGNATINRLACMLGMKKAQPAVLSEDIFILHGG